MTAWRALPVVWWVKTINLVKISYNLILTGHNEKHYVNKLQHGISRIIFMGRWLQAPLYLGLLFILTAYVYRFIIELFHLMVHIHSADNTCHHVRGVGSDRRSDDC